MSKISGQKDKYGKLLMVSMDGSIPDFEFTKKKFVATEKIVDELTKLHFKFAVHDRITRRTMIYGADQEEEEIIDLDGFSDPGCNPLYRDAIKRGLDCGVDVLVLHASEKHAFIYEIDGMDDFDEYRLVFDESEVVESPVNVIHRTSSRRVERSSSCPDCCFRGIGDVERKEGRTCECDAADNCSKKLYEDDDREKKQDLSRIELEREESLYEEVLL